MTDLRHAFRRLLKTPGFTAVAVLTLALGIGATTALFSVIYGVLISPYPYARPHEIWVPGLSNSKTDQRMRPYRQREYLEIAKLPAFAEVMATRPGGLLLTGEFAPESLAGICVSGNAFDFLGVPPLLGRTLQPSDIGPTGEAERVVVLSFRRWQKLFGGDPHVLGRTLRLDDRTHVIVGVMPPRFGWWTSEGVWLPLGLDPGDSRGVFPIVRLKPGTGPAAAGGQLHALQSEMAKANPSGFPTDGFATTFTNYLDVTQASGEMQRSLQLLFGAVGFLLLIACANVANLQLAQATSRGREIAIRLSMGAQRRRIVAQLLTESVVLALLGGLLGLVFAYWITHLMVALMPADYVPNESRIEVNGRVLAFSVLVSLATGVLFGLVPALQSSRPDLVTALKEEGRGSISTAGGRTRSLLVVTEVVLSMVLLVSAGMTLRSFLALQQVDLGFQPDGVLTVGLPLPAQRYVTRDQRNRFARELLERVRLLPSVEAATIGNGGLPFGGPDSSYGIEGQPDGESQRIRIHAVAADYLATLRIPLHRGRMMTGPESQGADRVAVINEPAARLWPQGENPLGRRLRLDFLLNPGRPELLVPTNASPYFTVIGVMGDARNDDLRSQPQPAVLVPYGILAPPQRTLAVRFRGDQRSLLDAVRAQVREMDPQLPVTGGTMMEERLTAGTAQPRFIMALFTLFAGLGLALAMAGIYGVLSYLVSIRTREIGVRMALGAQRSDVLGLIFRSGGKLVGIGMAAGAVASFGAARLLSSQLELFGTGTVDPISFAGVLVLLGSVAAAACFIPARRAARIDPMEALRRG